MALPEGILAGTVTFGQAVSLIGGKPTSMSFTIKPTHDLVHVATGVQILDFTETITVEEGMPGSITLPYTDQPGFRNAAGDAFSNWAYQVTGVFRGPGGQTKSFTRNFQLPMGQSVVDFDLIPGGTISLPVTAPVARVTSVAGKTGAISVEDLIDAGLGGEGGPTTVESLVGATELGKSVVKAATAADAREALGAVSLDAAAGLTEVVDGKADAAATATALAARVTKAVADQTYAPVARALPVGGSTGQIPVKTTTGIAWTDAGATTMPTIYRGFSPAQMAAGGGGGGTTVTLVSGGTASSTDSGALLSGGTATSTDNGSAISGGTATSTDSGGVLV